MLYGVGREKGVRFVKGSELVGDCGTAYNIADCAWETQQDCGTAYSTADCERRIVIFL